MNIRNLAIALLATLCIFSCKEKPQKPHYTLSGKFGSGGDTIYIYGMNSSYDKIDTIITAPQSGEFTYEIEEDESRKLKMVLPSGEILNIFTEPDAKATLAKKGKTWVVTGSKMQERYNSLIAKFDTISERSRLYEAIGKHIKENAADEMNFMLLERYYLDIDDPKSSLIRERLKSFAGTLHDNPLMGTMEAKASSKRSNAERKAFPAIRFTDSNDSVIVLNTFKKKYFVATLWASWDSISVKRVQELSAIADSLGNEHFDLLNISLDYDTAAWRKTIADKEIKGRNVCDTKMWANSIAESFLIKELPFSMLVNYDRIIMEYNPPIDDLYQKADSLVTKYKKRLEEEEERRKKAEKEKKKEEKKKKAGKK